MSNTEGPRLTPVGRLFMLAFLVACGAGAWYLFTRPGARPNDIPPAPQNATANKQGPAPAATASCSLRIAYGTEKKRWLEWAVMQFANTPQGKNIQVELIPKGSIEGARATVNAKERIHVWTPASSAYRDVFVQEWALNHNEAPFIREEPLALSPMVFVFWEERYEAFVAKFKEVSFATVNEALNTPGGWQGIAEKPEWGFFKFGISDPNQSNSGLLTLVLSAQQFHQKGTRLTMADAVDARYNQWLKNFARSLAGLSNSTGNMMRDMVLKGPATYDALMVYESVVIDYLKNAEGRWGSLHVSYPRLNIWNDNPYYIINADWLGADERKAAEAFLAFLLSEPAQKQALVHGYRPAEPSVSLKQADSPFTLYQKNGLRIEIPSVCEAPPAEIITNLLTGWQRARGQ